MSVVFFFSYFPQGYYSTKFTITGLGPGLTCIAAPFTALVFDANHPHCGSGDGFYTHNLLANSPLCYAPLLNFTYPADRGVLHLDHNSDFVVNSSIYYPLSFLGVTRGRIFAEKTFKN